LRECFIAANFSSVQELVCLQIKSASSVVS
jgi:hypothetical protein